MSFDKWFLVNKDSSEKAKLRLFLFPPAGSDVTIFNKWEDNFSSYVEVCKLKLPGRGMRYNEPLESNCQILADKIAEVIDENTNIPFVIFGHSMGALIAYETAILLQAKGNKFLKEICLSAMKSPDCVSDDGCFENDNSQKISMHSLSDAELQKKLIEFGGMPSEILSDSSLIEFLLPIFRNDLYLCDTYHLNKKIVLNIPIVVYGGKSDSVANSNDLAKWKDFSSKKVHVLMFQGNHFYFEMSKAMFMFDLSKNIERLMEEQ